MDNHPATRERLRIRFMRPSVSGWKSEPEYVTPSRVRAASKVPTANAAVCRQLPSLRNAERFRPAQPSWIGRSNRLVEA